MTERVLAVPRAAIERFLRQGFIDGGFAEIMEAVGGAAVFLDRPAAETDPSHKQIIPYVAVTHQDRFLVYRRTKKQGEARLHDKLSLGFGGHINDIDGKPNANTNLILAAVVRELNEEVFIPALRQLRAVGFINDDSSAVGQVHLGVAFIVESASERFAVNEPEAIEAQWSEAEEIEDVFPKLETWSQLLWTHCFKSGGAGSGLKARAIA